MPFFFFFLQGYSSGSAVAPGVTLNGTYAATRYNSGGYQAALVAPTFTAGYATLPVWGRPGRQHAADQTCAAC